MIYSLITACIRPNNLLLLYQSILKAKEDFNLYVKWYIVMEARNREPVLPDTSWANDNSIEIITKLGEPKKSPINTALDLIVKDSDSWVAWLDDDNILHPNYFEFMQKVSYPGIIIYNQQLTKILAPVNPLIRLASKCAPGAIDTGQFTVSSCLIGETRWGTRFRGPGPNEPPQPDGEFIEDVYINHRDKLQRVNHVMAYYNYLS